MVTRRSRLLSRGAVAGFLVGATPYLAVYAYFLYGLWVDGLKDQLILLAFIGMPLTVVYSLLADVLESSLTSGQQLVVDWIAMLVLGVVQFGGIGFLIGYLLSSGKNQTAPPR